MLDKKNRYLIEVVEAGSFSAAARKLFVSQSAVSQQISLLETELGIQLLDRSGYRPVLTNEGLQYYRFCKEAENQFQEMLTRLRRESNTIRIAFTGAYENRPLLQLTASFRKVHPNVTFSYIEGTFEEMSSLLTDGSVDLALGLDTCFDSPPLRTEILYHYQMCVITSFDHPLADRKMVEPRDLKRQDFIVLGRNFGRAFYHGFMEAFTLDGCSKNQIVKEAETFDELVASVSIGEGIAIAAENVIDTGTVARIPLIHSHHKSDYVIACRTDAQTDLIKSFIDAAKIYFRSKSANRRTL